jgi:hypothetical protein
MSAVLGVSGCGLLRANPESLAIRKAFRARSRLVGRDDDRLIVTGLA